LNALDGVPRPVRKEFHFVANLDAPCTRNPRNNGAQPFEYEAALDMQFKGAGVISFNSLVNHFFKCRQKIVEPFACLSREAHHGCFFKEGPCYAIANVSFNISTLVLVSKVNLVHNDDAALDAEHAHNLDMFDGLWHDAVIGRHDEHDDIDAACASHHVVNKALVARHVNNAHAPAIGTFPDCKPQVNRHATRLFFRQLVTPAPSQASDDGGLAVINVAGSSQRDVDIRRCRALKREVREAAFHGLCFLRRK